MGTPAYMAPEQVRGEPADHRADIFAFGCVLYEMLSGTRAFRRNTPVESMNAILNEEPPDLSAKNANVPLTLERVIRRCLEKNPERRFQSADDLAFAIENAGTAFTAPLGSVEAGKEDARLPMIKLLPWMIAALCLAGITFMFVQRQKAGGSDGAAPVAAVRKFEISLPDPPRKPASLSLIEGIQPAISPDGRKLAYSNAEGLWLRWLDHIASPVHLVAGEEIFSPFWSPSSTDLAYFDARKLCRISASGGGPTPIVTIAGDLAAPVSGGAWLSAERIIFATGMSGLFEAPSQGGRVRTVLDTDNGSGDLDFHHASPLPESRGVLFAVHRDNIGVDTVCLWTPEGKRKKLLQLPGGRIFNPVYSPSGHVVFERFDVVQGLWAFPFSLVTLERTGEPFRVSVAGTQPSTAGDGTLVFSSNDRKVGLRQLTWIDRSGKIVGTVGRPMPGLGWPRLSADGSRIVAASGDTLSTLDLWMFDLAGGGAIPITRQPEREDTPAWWNEGRTVLFTRFRDSGAQVFAKAADGSGPEQLLFDGSSGDLSRSGKYLLLTQQGPGGRMTSGYVSLADNKKRIIQLPEEFQRVYWFRLSPDDRLLAYHSAEGGKNIEVYVVDFPAFTNKRNVSRGWGRQPEWDPTGAELFFLGNKARTLMSARVKGSGESLETPEKVFDLPERIYSENPWRMGVFDVAPKGDRFLMLKDVEQETSTNQLAKPNVQVVLNWFEEFRAKK